MVSTVSCQHCGDEHPADLRRCPKTGDAMSDPGPCGTKINRYLVKKLLGVGGFGAVYLAEHTRTAARVALKVLKRERAEDAAAVERFMREARAAALLGSEHIARVLDAEVSADGIPFIAMELLEGTDLAELDKDKGPLHPERLVNIMIQALDALQAAHEKGIVHRDMKPANVFVTKKRDALGVDRDFVKLLDFGISKMQATGERALTLAGTTMGTPAYMAYEQFFDARSVDGRADVYSVAAILYELLSRQRPYTASSYGELVMKVEKETPLPLKQVAPSLPEQLCAVIDKGLRKDRDERWQSARELAEALSKIGSLRGVVLKTEISHAAISPLLLETKAHVPAQPPTTEPRPQSSRGEVKTVMMDTSEPSPNVGPVPVMSSRATGNETVLMNPDEDPRAPYRTTAQSQAQRPTRPGPPPSDEVPPTDPLKKPLVDEQQAISTDVERKALPGPRDETQESIRAAMPPGLVASLGWKLLAALGAGAVVVIVMLLWVISLARRGH